MIITSVAKAFQKGNGSYQIPNNTVTIIANAISIQNVLSKNLFSQFISF